MPSKQPSGTALGVRPYVSQTGAFTNGSDSPRAFLERCLEVIAAQEDAVGAFVTLNIAGARAAADASTARWKAGATLSPIDGMPVGIKDIMETADMATEQGSPLFVGWHGKRDCAAVAAPRSRCGGARENGDDRCRIAPIEHAQPLGSYPHAGRVEQWLGGSGGHRHDSGGPGIAGHRLDHPPRQLLWLRRLQAKCRRYQPRRQLRSFQPELYGRVGCYPRRYLDGGARHGCVPVAIRAITASRTNRATSRTPAAPYRPPGNRGLARSVRGSQTGLGRARQRLQAAGIEVIDRTSHDAIAALETAIAEARPLSMAINAWEGRWPLNTYASDMDRHGLSSSAQGRLAEAQNMSQAQYQGLLSERQRIREVYAALHTVCDACMTLAAPGAAPIGLDWTGNPVFTVPTSLLGVPSLSLPVFEDDGLPLGLQLVGFTDRDADVFSVASAIMALFAD